MKIPVTTTIKPGLIPLIFIVTILSATAQKQPQVQEISQRAPANIKTDGKLNEWDYSFLNAFNPASRIFYTVSNDDKNLYFTVRGQGWGVGQKIFNGGITFTISHSTEKKLREKNAGNVIIKFPLFPTKQTTANASYIMGPIANLKNLLIDSIANRKEIDSILLLVNKRINETIKEIGVTGIKEIPDSLISIYNTTGIKVAAQFMKQLPVIKLQPVIEIAIPLKYLGLSTTASNQLPFSYNIKLNGALPGAAVGDDADPNELYLKSSSDLWGIYTLAKKP